MFCMERRMQRYYQSTFASQGNFLREVKRTSFLAQGNSTTGVISENSFYRFS